MVQIIEYQITANMERQRVQMPADAKIVDAIYDERSNSFFVVAELHPESLLMDRHNMRYFVTAANGYTLGLGLRDYAEHIRSARRAAGLALHLYEMKNLSGGA